MLPHTGFGPVYPITKLTFLLRGKGVRLHRASSRLLLAPPAVEIGARVLCGLRGEALPGGFTGDSRVRQPHRRGPHAPERMRLHSLDGDAKADYGNDVAESARSKAHFGSVVKTNAPNGVSHRERRDRAEL